MAARSPEPDSRPSGLLLESLTMAPPPRGVACGHSLAARVEASGAVDELAENVSVARVPVRLGDRVRQDVLQRHLLDTPAATMAPARRRPAAGRRSPCRSGRRSAGTTRRCAARDSSAVAHMSAFASVGSSTQGSDSSNGRPNAAPKCPHSTVARCLTRPSRFVPVGTSGRRMSYSPSPSSFPSTASRASCRYRCRSVFASGLLTPAA